LHEAPQYVLRFRHGSSVVRLYIDAVTALPTATEASFALNHVSADDVAWNALGDLIDRTEYMNWYVVDGLRYPSQLDLFRNGVIYRTTTVSEVHFDVSIDESALTPAPQSLVTAAKRAQERIDDLPLGRPIPHAPDPSLPVAEIAPGVVQIPGSWYSTLVRQPDGIVVIDAPISAGYSRRVMAEAERRFPGVPIKALITSTGFLWHIAGVREYAARGVPIYICDRNVSTVERLLRAPHTLVPDDLARSPPVSSVIRPVSNRTVIGSGRNALVLWPIRRATQAMLMTYLADARLLHTGEMVQPLGTGGALLYPESLLEITQAVQDAGLAVDRMIGMHMSPTPWSAVADALHVAGLNGDGSP
jgi:hypothetical protein